MYGYTGQFARQTDAVRYEYNMARVDISLPTKARRLKRAAIRKANPDLFRNTVETETFPRKKRGV